MISGGFFEFLIAFLIPHSMVEPLFFTFSGSWFLSYSYAVKFNFFILDIVSFLYFKLIADWIFEYFLLTASNAVATCFDPPYSKFPATITSSPALTILPEIPSISLIDFGFCFE